MTERLHFHFSYSCVGEGNGNPLQCSCLENPREDGAWWAAIYGVAQSRTRLKQLSSSSIPYFKVQIHFKFYIYVRYRLKFMFYIWWSILSVPYIEELLLINSFFFAYFSKLLVILMEVYFWIFVLFHCFIWLSVSNYTFLYSSLIIY